MSYLRDAQLRSAMRANLQELTSIAEELQGDGRREIVELGAELSRHLHPLREISDTFREVTR